MANPVPCENQIMERIEKEKLTIPKPVWEVLSHHLGNDTLIIYLAGQSMLDTPAWILRAGNVVMRVLYRVSFQRGQSPNIEEISRYTVERAGNIGATMQRFKRLVM